jgi:RimJ/RimL family protein N-acetyltransferase
LSASVVGKRCRQAQGGIGVASWLPADFKHPDRLDLSTGHHLRPIAESDLDLDYPAVMGSRERLWETYGEAWGWPPATMTVEQDRAELAWHAEEMATGRSFNYAIFDHDERELLGCVYIDPPAAAADTADPAADGADAAAAEAAVVSWWVVDHEVGGHLEAALNDAVPRWLSEDWRLPNVRYGP